jgi:hypothetical protein
MGAVVFVAVIAGLLVAVQMIPEWQVKRASVRSTAVNPEAATKPAEIANLQNEMRKTLVQVVGGVFALLALYFTYRRVKVSEQGHITDRYTKAIEQLGAITPDNKPNLEVRLGGIYALERIAFDSPRDHWSIMEVLTAYVRHNAPASSESATEAQTLITSIPRPATEIQAILTVLGRRRLGHKRERKEQYLELGHCDLRGAFLHVSSMGNASFYLSNLEWTVFQSSHLEGARFGSVHGKWAYFTGAHLQGADFDGANLEEATFNGAHLERASFTRAHLKEASFVGTHLQGTSFVGAVGLDVEQFAKAQSCNLAKFDQAFSEKLGSARGTK